MNVGDLTQALETVSSVTDTIALTVVYLKMMDLLSAVIVGATVTATLVGIAVTIGHYICKCEKIRTDRYRS